MDLNDYQHFRKIDRENMYGEIKNLPAQLMKAWQLGLQQPLQEIPDVDSIIIAGMGGSAIGADLLASYVSRFCSVPIVVQREYWLPKWVGHQKTLVIASSHSGNTEETLNIFNLAKSYGAKRWAISTGGELADLANNDGVPFWQFEHNGQPRAAVGYSFGMMLAFLSRSGLIPDQTAAVTQTVDFLQNQQAAYRAEITVEKNPAKKLAASMYGKWVYILASDYLAPVARRWKGQINELAKAWAQYESLPEADHNTLAGTSHPEIIKQEMKSFILRSQNDHLRNQLRASLTKDSMQGQGLDVEVVDIEADDPLPAIWSALILGDYAAYYLAMLYEVDPTPINIMQTLKEAMRAN